MRQAVRDLFLSLLLVPVFALLASGVLFGVTVALRHPHPVTIAGGLVLAVLCTRGGMAFWGRYTGR